MSMRLSFVWLKVDISLSFINSLRSTLQIGLETQFASMSMSERKTIDLEQGWDFMQKGITKLKNILEGLPESQFSSEDYMMLYTYPQLFPLISCLNS